MMTSPSTAQGAPVYQDVVKALAQAHRELGDLLAVELDTKLRGYTEVIATVKFVKDAEHHANLKALRYSKEILILRGEIAALTLELEWARHG